MSVAPSALVAGAPVRVRTLPRRLLVPSFSDVFFVSLLVWLFMSSPDGWSRLLLDGDTGWHIRAGEWVLRHGAVPHTDLFSFSMEGKPWFAWEWGADAIFALLHGALGLKGVVLFGGAMIALYAAVLFRYTLWRGANPLLALAVSLVAIGASSIHYFARPHLFTLVLVPVSVWMIERDRRAAWSGVWGLVPLAAVWTNLHGGFLALISLLGLLAVGTSLRTLLEDRAVRDWRQVRRYWLLTAGCSLATVANPYGIELHRHIAAYLRSDWIREAVQEFQSPSFRNENIYQFELLLLAGLIACAPLIARRAYPEALWLLFWAHQALGSVRHVTVYATLAAPLIALEATRLWDRYSEGASRRSVRRILGDLARDIGASFRWTSLWPAAALLALVAIDRPIQWPTDFPSLRFPTRIIERHQARVRDGRVLTTDQWADYLIYRFYPRTKVYIDGRSDFYGPALGREYIRLSYGQHDWRRSLDRHGFDVALVPAEWSLASLLKQEASWKLLEDDGKALLFVRDRAQSAPPAKKVPAALMKTAEPSELPRGEHSGMKNEKRASRSPIGPASAAPLPAADPSRRNTPGYDSAGWKLPSGLELAEFALKGGFIAPGLLPRHRPSPPPMAFQAQSGLEPGFGSKLLKEKKPARKAGAAAGRRDPGSREDAL